MNSALDEVARTLDAWRERKVLVRMSDEESIETWVAEVEDVLYFEDEDAFECPPRGMQSDMCLMFYLGGHTVFGWAGGAERAEVDGPLLALRFEEGPNYLIGLLAA